MTKSTKPKDPIEVLLTVKVQGDIERAARSLGMSASDVEFSIKSLEKAVGARLVK